MKKDARLPILIDRIQAGQLSRNQHFEAYGDPVVRDARDRHARLGKLAEILAEPEGGGWEFSLKHRGETHGETRWELFCRSRKLNLSWSAKLHYFELELLREDPRVREHLDTKPMISPAFA